MKKTFALIMVAMMAVGCFAQLPSVTLKNIDGKTVDTAKLNNDGKPFIISFFATWCKPCQRELDAIHEQIVDWEEETGVKVALQFKGRTGIREGLQPALDAGTKIDLFDEDIDRVNTAWGKYLMDLETLAADADYEATANAGLMAACREAAGGTLKSIPYQPNVFGFFYNVALFEEAGIEAVPTTWDEFLAVCEQLKAAGITPMTMDDAYATCVIGYHLGRYVGEEGVRKIVTEGLWDDPAVLQMAKDIEELASKGYFSENVGTNVWPNGQNVELAGGQVAMYLNGSWLPNEVKATQTSRSSDKSD